MSEVRRESVKQWFDGTLYSRLDSKKDDVIVIVMQRVHVDDLVGHVLGRQRQSTSACTDRPLVRRATLFVWTSAQ